MCRFSASVSILYASKPNDMSRLRIGHSHMYMHNGQRDWTEWVNERDRVVRDMGARLDGVEGE